MKHLIFLLLILTTSCDKPLNKNGMLYDLIVSDDPCYIFQHYGVSEMHGLNLKDCKAHVNTTEDAYIAGWCNYIPKPDKDYKTGDRMFVFINMSRCKTDYDLITTINHELMHLAVAYYDWNIEFEEEMITMAEEETKKVYQSIKNSYGN